MDKVVTSIQGLSSTDEDIQSLKTFLGKQDEVLLKAAASGQLDDAIAALDPGLHSLGMLHLLAAKSVSRFEPQRFIAQVQRFVQHCSPAQIRISSVKYCKLCRKFSDLLVELRQPLRGIATLKHAIAVFAASSPPRSSNIPPTPAAPSSSSNNNNNNVHPPSSSSSSAPSTTTTTNDSLTSGELTTMHTDLMQLCLLAKFPKPALSVLAEDFFEVSNETSAITIKDVLCYYYYGGMIYIAMKRFKDAIQCFRSVITAPAHVVSAVMLEAYKKYILVCLIELGSIPPLPKYSSSVAGRQLKTLATPYHDFASIFGNPSMSASSILAKKEGKDGRDNKEKIDLNVNNNNNNNATIGGSAASAPAGSHVDELHKVASHYAEIFQKDNNLGLVKQCIHTVYASAIKKHTQTYITLSLQDMMETVKLPSIQDAQQAVLRMIEDGEVYARINQRDGMVAFEDNPEHFDTNAIMTKLDARISSIMSINKKLRMMDDSISKNPHYVNKVLGHERIGGGGGRFPAELDEGFGDERGLGGGGGQFMGRFL
eukprot:TRINITY_DN803_c0_g1_i3.p1 TRINITY_DN803_c0_g1~~TRINITY_DN803_c0_g1_i3.p1  ORF type:complete len:548 (-),score=185.51 TRINITY_DN803_c0_g1_i3:113-1732(-)